MHEVYLFVFWTGWCDNVGIVLAGGYFFQEKGRASTGVDVEGGSGNGIWMFFFFCHQEDIILRFVVCVLFTSCFFLILGFGGFSCKFYCCGTHKTY